MCCGDVKSSKQLSDSRSGLPDELRLLKFDASFCVKLIYFQF